LQETKKDYLLLIDNMPDAYARHQIVTDELGKPVDYIFTEVNPAFEQMTGLVRDNIIGKNVTEILPGIEKSKFNWIETYGKVALYNEKLNLVQYSEPLDRWYEVYAFSTEHGYFETIFRDITELHETETKLRESEKRSRATLKALPDLLFVLNSEGIFLDYHANDEGSLLTQPTDFVGHSIGAVLPELLAAKAKELIRETLAMGELQALDYSLEFDSGIKYFTAQFNKMDQERVLAVVREHTRQRVAEDELKKTVHAYQLALTGIIESMGSLLEKRDPYTAGHQQRVAKLAVAIAEEMQLEHKQVEGIRMAALVHDIGKIEVPAEILSKPGELSDLEFMMIRQHPQAGYQILCNIDFPWPLADTILQHHEKMNGSGYPQGLKGEEILLEAKILCVADVLEAMASHRPYRPALGLDQAIQEISENRGELYDCEVVDAALRLFKDKGFIF
jgi:putative nucleotidyltransferase with HDIG domain/PAS domain S-box-containing protein